MKILGLSAFYHDSAAALIDDGKIIAAAEEERFSRLKHDASFPEQAARFCIEQAGGSGSIDAVVFYDKPFLKFERLIKTYLESAPRGVSSFVRAMPSWLHEKLFLKQALTNRIRALCPSGRAPPLYFTEHHHAHAAAAYFPSPFDRAAVLCVDGVGEWVTTSLWQADQNRLRPILEIHFPHSLGLLYSAFTAYLGFRVNSGEYKVMGLAPYGRPIYRDLILQELIEVKPDGSFKLNLKYFSFTQGSKLTTKKFDRLFGGPSRVPESELRQKDMDLAASIQSVLEDVLLKLARTAQNETGAKNLCLGGGVALNCVANAKIFRSGLFDDIWIQPAAGDAGSAIGAALALYHEKWNGPRCLSANHSDGLRGAFLGSQESAGSVQRQLRDLGAVFESLTSDRAIEQTAEALAAGQTVGWFSGAMEFGPRALGHRSILADPRVPDMRETLNRKIKLREIFRPFAPAVARESLDKYFFLETPSPYMLFVAEVRSTVDLPAITHVDRSARVQSVDRDTDPRFHALLKAFERRTGIDVLINTSFNVRGEPIVRTASDAYRCFMDSGLDVLVIENEYLEKSRQPQGDWRREVSPD